MDSQQPQDELDCFYLSGEKYPDGLSFEDALHEFEPIGNVPFWRVHVNCALSSKAATVLANQLVDAQKLDALRTIKLNACLAGLSEDEGSKILNELAPALVGFKKLEVVDLSNNLLGAKGLVACGPIFQLCENIRALNLSRTNLDKAAMRLLRGMIMAYHTHRLETLSLSENILEDEGTRYVALVVEKLKGLRNLNLASVQAGPDGIEILLEVLEKSTCLERLSIADNRIDSRVVSPLQTCMSQNPRISTLVLRDLCMGDEVACSILEAIESSPLALKHFDISGNDLSDTSADALVQCLRKQQNSLETLLIGNNKWTTDTAVEISNWLTSAPQNLCLRAFAIHQTLVADLGLIKIANALAQIESFQVVYMQAERITDDAISEISQVLQKRVRFVNEGDGASVHETSLFPQLKSTGLDRSSSSELDAPESVALADDYDEGDASASLNVQERQTPTDGISATSKDTPSLQTDVTLTAEEGEPSLDPSPKARAVLSSAVQLRSQIKSLRSDVSSLFRELKPDEGRGQGRACSDPGLMPDDSEVPQLSAQPLVTDLINIIWGFVISGFICVVIAAIIQRQDEAIFSPKPI